MFSESLLDSSAGRARRGWSTLLAWALQCGLIALAVVLPLWHTNALPHASFITPIGPPPGAPPPKSPHPIPRDPARARPIAVISPDSLTSPIHIPKGIDRTPDTSRAAEVAEAPCTFCVPGGIGDPNGRGPGILKSILPPPAEAAPPPPVARVKMSGGVSQGYLVHQVQPAYPAIARAARIEGTVALGAVINRDGTIQGLHAISGPPMLVNAAMDAVRQWRYRPYLLSGQPVEVETQISVIFTLAR